MQIGFSGLLFILFLALKLTGVIAWAWVWVTAPLWIPLIIVVLFLLIPFLLVLITAMVGACINHCKK